MDILGMTAVIISSAIALIWLLRLIREIKQLGIRKSLKSIHEYLGIKHLLILLLLCFAVSVLFSFIISPLGIDQYYLILCCKINFVGLLFPAFTRILEG